MNEPDDKTLEELKKEKMKEIAGGGEESEFPEEPIELTDQDFQDAVDKYPLLIVDFWAGWCGPCKAMEPIIEELAEEYSGQAVFGELNVDRNSQIPNKFSISGIPTLLVFKDGEFVDRMVGMVQKKKLEQRLKKYID